MVYINVDEHALDKGTDDEKTNGLDIKS